MSLCEKLFITIISYNNVFLHYIHKNENNKEIQKIINKNIIQII